MGNPTEEIKAKLDIAELVQEYVKLTRAGTNYKGLCPFHREKTPSFMVSSDKQIYHCFGCGEGGDVFSFIMKIEGVEFPEALRVLAAKAGVKLEPRNPQLENQKTKLLDINRLATAYFHKVLLESSQAAIARDYVKKRGLNDLTLEEFKIGYSVDDWEALQSFLLKKGYSAEEIFDAGLSIKKERGDGYYDRFRGRLMFPLADVHGQIVGFGGRILAAADGSTAAKYINTPQTAIYNKSAILYTLDRAKKEIQKQKLAIVVEGYMDALASHQAGVENVVASSGTALTQEQVRLLRRYCQTAALAFDTDPAGSDATRRGLEIAWQHELETRIVVLPFGKDPDECIQRDPAAWKRAIAEARPFMEYYFDKTFKEADLTTVAGKKQAAKILLPLISHLPDQIEQTHYLQKLASAIHVEERHLRERLPKARQAPVDQVSPAVVRSKDRIEQLSELVVGIALKFPEHLEYIIQNIQPEYLKGEGIAELYKTVVIYYTKANSVNSDELFTEIAGQNVQLSEKAKMLILLAESLFEEPTEAAEYRKTLIEAVPVLKKQFLSQAVKHLQDELAAAEARHDQQRIQTLLGNITSLTEELGHLS